MESVQHTMQPKERIGFGDNGAPAAFASTKKEVGDEVRMGAYSELVIPSHDLELLQEDGNGPSSRDETWTVQSPDKDREGVMGLEMLLPLSEMSYKEVDCIKFQKVERR